VLILLPILTFVLIFLALLGQDKNSKKSFSSYGYAFLTAAVLWGVIVIISAEILTLFQALNRLWISVIWILAGISISYINFRQRTFHIAWKRIQEIRFSSGVLEHLFLTGFALILGALLVIALVTPTNNVDSLQYHMPRVVHWAQNNSLAHYPTAYEPQLWHGIWAETAILHLRILWGNDQPANLVQYFSLFGSLIAVYAIAKQLGAGRWGRILTVAYALSIPMAILQSTSTQNDLVAGFWLLTFIFLLYRAKDGAWSFWDRCYLGSVLGLGMLTKGTFYPLVFPFLIWLIFWTLKSRGWKLAILDGLQIIVIVSLLNSGVWIRNAITYGGPLGPPEYIISRSGGLKSISGLVSNILRNVLLNFPTPWSTVNSQIGHWVTTVEGWIGLDSGSYQLLWMWNHEDLAGNPIHMLLIPGILIFGIFLRRSTTNSAGLLVYVFLTSLSFIMLSYVAAVDPFNVRLQLPFLLLWAPVVGVVVGRSKSRFVKISISGLFLFAALPWVLFNRTRPLIGLGEHEDLVRIVYTDAMGSTRVGSVLVEDRETLLFANYAGRQDEYHLLAKDLKVTDCMEVGLRIDSHDPEYIFWWVLDAPQSGFELQSFLFGEHLKPYVDESKIPCAIICTICGDRNTLHGLSLEGNYGDAKLFLGGQYSTDKDG
jgi:hypothetical protein